MSPTALEGISWIDGVGVVVVVAFGVIGLLKGAIRFIVGLATVVVGIMLAGTFGESLGAQGWPFIEESQNSQRIGVLVGCAIVFAATLLAGALVVKLLRAAAEETHLGGTDRAFGLLFGLVRGVLYVALLTTLLMFVRGVFPDLKSLHGSLDESWSLELTRVVAGACRGWFPTPMGDWLAETLQLPVDGSLHGPPAPLTPR